MLYLFWLIYYMHVTSLCWEKKIFILSCFRRFGNLQCRIIEHIFFRNCRGILHIFSTSLFNATLIFPKFNLTTRKNTTASVPWLIRTTSSGQPKKMFVCENPGGQRNVHQAGRESIFFLIFRLCIQTKFSKELKR